MKLTLIRSATLRIEYAGQTLLVDPQLDPARCPNRQIVAVHFECVSHSTETRADLRQPLRREGVTNVVVPEDGAAV